MPVKTICLLVGICDKTVYKIKKEVSLNNIDNLLIIKGGGRISKLIDFELNIINEISINTYYTLQQIVDMISEKFKIKTSLSAVGRLLKKHDIKRFKSGSIPAKADTEKQRIFYESILRPLMDKANSCAISLLYLDASHFVMGNDYLGYIYGKCRRFLKTFSGRMRYNVLGALDIITKQVTTITNNSYINAVSVKELLEKIALLYKGKNVYIILDNAKYQKCRLVQDYAKSLGINLIFIPPYSPNLNLIERFWKYTKSKLRTKYYDNFAEFSERIDYIIHSRDENSTKAINTLISENFQFFDNLEKINETTFVNTAGEKKAA